MNRKCPVCSHEFRFGERKRFVSWHLSRRAAACPDCHMILVWEGKAFARAVTGLLLASVFDGFALGMSLVQNRFLFGFSDPSALDDLKWEAWPLAFRLTQIGFLAL